VLIGSEPDLVGAPAASNTTVYLSSGDVFSVLDTTLPESPTLRASVTVPELIWDVAVLNGTAYLAISDGMQIIDVTDPDAPQLRGRYDAGASVRDVAADDDTIFLSTHDGLRAVAVDSPDAPSLAYAVPIPNETGDIEDIAVSEGLVYLALGAGGMISYDGATEVGALLGENASEIVVAGSTVLLSGSDTLRAVDVSTPETPVILDSVPFGRRSDLTLAGEVLLASRPGDGFRLIDAGAPTTLSLSAELHWPTGSTQIVEHHGVAVVNNDGTGSLMFLDVSEPATPRFINALDLPGLGSNVSSLSSAGSLLAAKEGDSIYMVQFGDPESPQLLGAIELPRVTGIAMNDALMVTIDNANDLQVIDITAPASPTLVGSVTIPTPQDLFDVELAGNHAYVAAGHGGMHVYDLSNLASPQLVSSVPEIGEVRSITVRDKLAYVMGYFEGHFLFDVSDPASPILLGGLDTALPSVRAEIIGDKAIAIEGDTIKAFDISDPSLPAFESVSPYRAAPENLVISGAWAIVADANVGIQTIQLLGCASPADLNAAGAGGSPDLGILLAAWGQANSPADLDGDGVVGPSDLGILLAAWTG